MAGKRIKASQRKQQIIEVATVLFSSHSYEKVTMSMVSSACEITEPALYRHFDSKENLYVEVLQSLSKKENLYVEVLQSLSKKVDTSKLAEDVGRCEEIEDVLNFVANHILKNNIKQAELSRLLLYAELLIKTLTRLIESKSIREVNPVITARCFVGMVMDCAVSKNLWGNIQGKKFQIKEVLENNVPIYARGLRK